MPWVAQFSCWRKEDMSRTILKLLAVRSDLGQVSFRSLVYGGTFASASRHNLEDEAAHQGNEAASDFQKEIAMNSVGLSQTEITSDNPCYRQLSGSGRKMHAKCLIPHPSSAGRFPTIE